MKPTTFPRLPLSLGLLALLAPHALGIDVGQIKNVAPEIVSAWKANGPDVLLIFRYDGTYYMIHDSDTRPGMERGTFLWNKATGAFSARTLVDTNGEGGLSHPAGKTSVSINGNTMTYNVQGEGSFKFSRVVNTDSPIVGSWFIPGKNITVTFLANGTYFHCEETNDAPFGFDGMEFGTYQWTRKSGAFSVNTLIDTNGDVGLNNNRSGATVSVNGNSLNVMEDGETFTLQRITTNPTPLAEPVFEVIKFENHVQRSKSTPALASPSNPGRDPFPYWGEAYILPSVKADSPTLKIGDKSPKPFESESGSPRDFEIAKVYKSKSLIDAPGAFPNGENYLFKSGSGSARLSYPDGGSFPVTPAVITGSGTWNSGFYEIDVNGTLRWSGHKGFNPDVHLTLLSIEDYTANPSVDRLKEFVIQGDVTSYDLGGKLIAGHQHLVTIEHLKIASSTTSGTGVFGNKRGWAYYNTNTTFFMKATAAAPKVPEIFEQPEGGSRPPGTDIILTVGTNNAAGRAYQWFRNEEMIRGQTGNSLALFNLKLTLSISFQSV